MGDNGALTVFTGRPGSGKSNRALYYAERIQANFSKAIVTNIILLSDKGESYKQGYNGRIGWDGLHNVFSLRGLLKAIIQHERIHLILDEAGVYASSGASRRNEYIAQFEMIIKLCRKFRMSVAWIDQRGTGSVPPTMRELAQFHVHKPYKTREVIYDGFPDSGWSIRKVKDIRVTRNDLTRIPYDHEAPGGFDFDLPWMLKMNKKGKEELTRATMRDVFSAIKNLNYTAARPALGEWLKKLEVEERRILLDNESDIEEGGPWSRTVTMREAIAAILDKWVEKEGIDPSKERKKLPSTKDLAYMFLSSEAEISRIKTEYIQARAKA
jgi:hypothetical protein